MASSPVKLNSPQSGSLKSFLSFGTRLSPRADGDDLSALLFGHRQPIAIVGPLCGERAALVTQVRALVGRFDLVARRVAWESTGKPGSHLAPGGRRLSLRPIDSPYG